MIRPKTIVIDIDGVIVKHHGNLSNQIVSKAELLPGVLEKFNEWNTKSYHIVLMTGRKESMRSLTEKMLSDFGLFYDVLVMGVTSGVRVIINDLKQDSFEPTAIALAVERNKGLAGCEI